MYKTLFSYKLMHFSEPAIWTVALIALWFTYPAGDEGITLCIFHHIGITWCPGCGIGRSMAHLMHGNVAASLQAHWFGIPALMIIGYRIISVNLASNANHGSHTAAGQGLNRYIFNRPNQ
ncbi:MAG: DUF2752 domain-containing protein [Cyclonatronaceae bacterium]